MTLIKKEIFETIVLTREQYLRQIKAKKIQTNDLIIAEISPFDQGAFFPLEVKEMVKSKPKGTRFICFLHTDTETKRTSIGQIDEEDLKLVNQL